MATDERNGQAKASRNGNLIPRLDWPVAAVLIALILVVGLVWAALVLAGKIPVESIGTLVSYVVTFLVGNMGPPPIRLYRSKPAPASFQIGTSDPPPSG